MAPPPHTRKVNSAMPKKDLWGSEIKQSLKECQWNNVLESLGDLYNTYNQNDAVLNDQTEMALDRLMTIYNDWLD